MLLSDRQISLKKLRAAVYQLTEDGYRPLERSNKAETKLVSWNENSSLQPRWNETQNELNSLEV